MVSIPEASVTVAKPVKVRFDVEGVFPSGEKLTAGGKNSPPSSYAPIVGAVPLLVSPLKSVVIPPIGVPADSKGDEAVGRKTVDELNKGAAETELAF